MDNDFEAQEKRIGKEIKSQLEVGIVYEPTFIVVLAVHPEKELNFSKRISTRRGTPIGGYVHDTTNENYLVKCLETFALGSIPVCAKIGMRGHCNWLAEIPLSESAIKKYLNDTQKSDLKKFQSLFDEKTKYEYVQFVSSN